MRSLQSIIIPQRQTLACRGNTKYRAPTNLMTDKNEKKKKKKWSLGFWLDAEQSREWGQQWLSGITDTAGLDADKTQCTIRSLLEALAANMPFQSELWGKISQSPRQISNLVKGDENHKQDTHVVFQMTFFPIWHFLCRDTCPWVIHWYWETFVHVPVLNMQTEMLGRLSSRDRKYLME